MGLSCFRVRSKTSQGQSAERVSGQYAGWLFFLFVLAVNLPNLLWLQPNSSLLLNGTEYMERLVLGMLLAACFVCLFARPWVAWLYLWLLFLWWLPLALGVRVIAGTPITATLIGTAVATSPAELSNLVTSIPSLWLALFALWNLMCLMFLYWLCRRSSRRWSWGFRGKTAFFCLAMLGLPYLVLNDKPLSAKAAEQSGLNPATAPERSAPRFSPGHTLHELDKADQQVGFSYRLPGAFPYELPWAAVQYSQARRAVNAIRAHLQEPDAAFGMQGYEPAAEVVVLVIGESSTRNAWRWFNPQAPATTPRLEARVAQGEHLFGFANTLAQSTATRQAVPSMLTAQPLIWPDGTPNPQATRSIVSVAADAGYATAWFSNQAAVGKHDGIIASYAEEAAATAFLNPSSFHAQGNYDAVLLPALQRHLDTHRQVFVVLHTMGSHFNYRHRYPAGFGPYHDTSDAREAYFNSVAYTDTVLDNIMEMLSLDGRKAVLVYAADHGESIPGGACAVGAANRHTRDAYEVPALVWLSDSYAQTWPAMAEQLKANVQQSYSVAAIPQTLLDLMRADSQVGLHVPEVQSFLRHGAWRDEQGQAVPDTWTKRLQLAIEENPCFMILR